MLPQFLDMNIPYHFYDYMSILNLIIFLLSVQIIFNVYRLIIFLHYAMILKWRFDIYGRDTKPKKEY